MIRQELVQYFLKHQMYSMPLINFSLSGKVLFPCTFLENCFGTIRWWLAKIRSQQTPLHLLGYCTVGATCIGDGLSSPKIWIFTIHSFIITSVCAKQQLGNATWILVKAEGTSVLLWTVTDPESRSKLLWN